MIVTIIKDIVEAIPLGTSPETYPFFVHGDKSFQNLVSDEITDEAIVYLDEPLNWSLDLKKSGYIEEVYKLSLFFGGKTQIDFTPDQHRTEIEKMLTMCRRFISILQSRDNIRTVKDASCFDVINMFDANRSGVVLNVTIVPFIDTPVCP